MAIKNTLYALSAAGLLVVLHLAGCSTTSLSGSWRDPQYVGGPARHVLVVGVAQKDVVRRIFEDEFVHQLQARGVQAVASYSMFSLDELKNRKAVEDAVAARGMDKVLVTRLVNKRVEEITQPGYVSGGMGGPYPYGRPGYSQYGWYDHYATSYDMVVQPPTTYKVHIATLESSLYDVSSGKPVWSAMLETELGDNVDATIRSFIEVVVKDLAKEGLI